MVRVLLHNQLHWRRDCPLDADALKPLALLSIARTQEEEAGDQDDEEENARHVAMMMVVLVLWPVSSTFGSRASGASIAPPLLPPFQFHSPFSKIPRLGEANSSDALKEDVLWVHQYSAPLRPWRYESLRVSGVRALRLRIRDRMN
eukprot:6213178-Pleurochrysis_carterae.AAC.7